MKLTMELDREDDGRWIGEVIELPGVMCYGGVREEAISNVERLAIEVIAGRIAHNELPSSALSVSFTIPDELLTAKDGWQVKRQGGSHRVPTRPGCPDYEFSFPDQREI